MNPHLLDLLSERNMVHFSTLMSDGSPKVEPVWAEVEGEHILITTDAKSIKAVNIERDARVAMSVISADDPYEQVLVRGVVVESRDDPDMVVLDRMSQRYLGRRYPRRRWFRRVVFVVEPSVVRSSRTNYEPTTPGE